MRAVWKLEPGAAIHEHAGLPQPTSFDDSARLDAFLDAVRWGAVSSADDRALQAPFRAGIEIVEVPWNPARLEQRIGRLDRFGQPPNNEVLIYHFVGKGFDSRTAASRVGDLEGDLEFLMRAVLKVEMIRQDLGKVGPVIALQVEEAMLGWRRALETQQAERDAEPVRKLLRFYRDLRKQLEKLRARLFETRRELRLSTEYIPKVVEIGLALAGQPQLLPAKVPGVWPDTARHRSACPVFRLPTFKGSWALCAHGLVLPHSGEIRPITFDPAVAAGRDDIALAHLNHRLVQMCLRLLRAEACLVNDNCFSPVGNNSCCSTLVPGDPPQAPPRHRRTTIIFPH